MHNQSSDLAEIHYRSHGKLSDKWDLYIEVYNQLLSKWRKEPIDVLEIGVQNGGSLETWAQYFSGARNLIGCDVNEKCAELQFDDPRINVIVGDATDPTTVAQIGLITETLDLVIDDGSHTSRDIVRAFTAYFHKLNPGGIYIAEDLHCCYWSEWGGGLCSPDSGMEFFKVLCDSLNSSYWHRMDISPFEYVNSIANLHDCSIEYETLQTILSIEFYDSLCIITKAPSGVHPRIQWRAFGGHDELVAPGLKNQDHSMPVLPQASNRPKSLLDAVRELDLLSSDLKAAKAELIRVATDLSNNVAELDKTRAELDNTRTDLHMWRELFTQLTGSLSWRLTRPLRAFKSLVYKVVATLMSTI